MNPDRPHPDEDGAGGILGHLGGRWVWIFVGLLVIVGVSVRLAVRPATSTKVASPTTTAAPASEPEATTTEPPPTSNTTPDTTVPPETSATTEPQVTDLWTMPDLVGKTLDTAKAEIVDLTDGKVNSGVSVADASGDRMVIVHENWRVCSQNPQPGSKFTPESGIALEVVKNGETCPNASALTEGAALRLSDRPPR